MQYSDEQIRRFKAEFAQRRKKQILLIIPLFAVLILMIASPSSLASLGLNKETMRWGFLAYVLGAVVFSLANWRCPACGGYLGRSFWIKFCSKCGAPLS
jgi:hypothetical protein